MDREYNPNSYNSTIKTIGYATSAAQTVQKQIQKPNNTRDSAIVVLKVSKDPLERLVKDHKERPEVFTVNKWGEAEKPL